MSTTDAAAFWDGVYAARPAASGPQPNARLTEMVMGLPPGDALDLGRAVVVEPRARHPVPEPARSRRRYRPGPGDMDGRAGRRTPADRDRTRRAHRRGHRPCPPLPPHRLTRRPAPPPT
jgi:hypothetical protein